jgi:hypothetical protein
MQIEDSDPIPETLISPHPVADFACTTLIEAIVPPGLVAPPIQCPQRSQSHCYHLKEPSRNHPVLVGSDRAGHT